MRCLSCNKKTFYYATFKEKRKLLDEENRFSGEYEIVYNEPVKCKGNISATRGESRTLQFGSQKDYSRVIVLSDTNIPIDENSVIWVGISPKNTVYNYIVKNIARSLNSVAIAIKEVDVSG